MTAELDKFLRKLKAGQADHAMASVTHPKGKTGFDYGRACGIVVGLQLAEQFLNEAIEEVADDQSK